MRQLAEEYPLDVDSDHPIAEVLRRGSPVLLNDDAALGRMAATAGQRQILQQLEPRSVMVVPLQARRHVFGALTLVSAQAGRRYDDADLRLTWDLAGRAALSVNNARLYQREHRVAEALQRSLLPELPTLPGLTVASRYEAATVGVDVGGDWYDVLALPDGAVGLAIGDVMGHDLPAAATMGQLRSMVRSYA